MIGFFMSRVPLPYIDLSPRRLEDDAWLQMLMHIMFRADHPIAEERTGRRTGPCPIWLHLSFAGSKRKRSFMQ